MWSCAAQESCFLKSLLIIENVMQVRTEKKFVTLGNNKELNFLS